VDQSEIEKLVGDLELAVDRLRSLYEQYFMGIEKIEPTVVRKDVDRRIYVLRKEQIRNTALRFRFHMLLQRYNTYQSYWQRICRDIENGTYTRHVIRAQRRFGTKRQSVRPPSGPNHAAVAARSLEAELAELDRDFAPAEMLSDGDFELDEEAPTTRRSSLRPPPISHRTPPLPRPPAAPRGSQPQMPPMRTPRPPPLRTPRPQPMASAPVGRPVAAPARAAPSPAATGPTAARAAPPPAAAPGPPAPAPAGVRRTQAPAQPAAQPGHKAAELPDERVRQLYSQYVETKRRQNESTASITYDAVAKSLRESSAKLRQKLGRPVDFEVIVKDGRAVLRPVVK
jgi:hypothetical protein